ncbi:protein LEAD-SENSITIVE 1 [Musa acuminata AAA Group]|uniref:protein LEAD-SENSITIVE 1 n=1 Tax=Musa acuminata AAA Group TaxID=214697 RepID=UPI0031DC4DC6
METSDKLQTIPCIHVGGSKVVHFTRKKDASFGSSSAASAICPTFPDCGFRQPDSGVILCRLDCFLGNGALYRFEYGVPPSLLAAGPVGMAAVTAGAYCAGRYITDIGVRKDVMKVAVDDLAATMGCRSSNERLVGNVSGGSGKVPSIEEEDRGR